MKHLTSFLLCVVALCALVLPSRAVLIGSYPGLDKLIEEAGTIAIVRIEDAPSSSGLDGWTQRNCYIYQTIKGDLKANQTVKILLNDTVNVKSNFDGCALAPMSTHLVFLNASNEAEFGASHSIFTYKSADIPLSLFGNETKPASVTLKAQIQTLLGRYKTYRTAQIKREDEVLDKALAE